MGEPITITVSTAGMPDGFDDEIAEILRARKGVPLTVGDLVDFVIAVRAARRAFGNDPGDPFPRDRSGALPRTVQLGSLVLHAPTMNAGWILELARDQNWWPDPAAQQRWLPRLSAYVLANGYDPEAMGRVATRALAEQTLSGPWMLACTCTLDELDRACRQLVADAYPEPEPEETPPDPKKEPTASRSSGTSCASAVAPPDTGSTKSPKHTRRGCSNKSVKTESARATPPDPSATNPPRSAPSTSSAPSNADS